MALHGRQRQNKMATENRKPREILAAIRRRSGLSGNEVAKAAGYKHGSGYYRLEQEEAQGDRPIAHESILRLIPVFRGRGSPPITIDELLAISDGAAVRDTGSASGAVRATVAATVEEAANRVVSGGVVRAVVRIEDGVFVDPSKPRDYGPSAIALVSGFPAGSQFAAVVADDSAAPAYPKLTALHCVKPTEFSAGATQGRRVVVARAAPGSALAEMVVGVVGSDGMTTLSGDALAGVIVGVVIGHYVKE